ncbi:ribosomal protein S5 domain 2-type protein [Haematococcus lacustris]
MRLARLCPTYHVVARKPPSVATKASARPLSLPTEYTSLSQAARLEAEVKKSKFIVTAWPVSSSKQALQCIRDASDPSASHNCWAYRVLGESRCSDDGEPAGTAGRPILSALEGEGLEGVAVLVTRHFGGTKLGSGGLVRAYGGAARDCLRAAPRQLVQLRSTLEVEAGYQVLGAVYLVLDRLKCVRLSEEYSPGSAAQQQVRLRFSVEASKSAEVQQALADATAGQVVAQEVPAAQEDEVGEEEEGGEGCP